MALFSFYTHAWQLLLLRFGWKRGEITGKGRLCVICIKIGRKFILNCIIFFPSPPQTFVFISIYLSILASPIYTCSSSRSTYLPTYRVLLLLHSWVHLEIIYFECNELKKVFSSQPLLSSLPPPPPLLQTLNCSSKATEITRNFLAAQ